MDINAYIRETDLRFDVVIGDLVDVADWDGFLASLYSDDFYTALKKVLAPGAVVATQAGMLHPANRRSHANVRKGLEAVFAHVASYGVYVPSFYSLWGYALASDEMLGLNEVHVETAKKRGEGILQAIGARNLPSLFHVPDLLMRGEA
jgi:spermidine synthase